MATGFSESERTAGLSLSSESGDPARDAGSRRAKRLAAVLTTYATRPLFRWMAATAAVCLAWYILRDHARFLGEWRLAVDLGTGFVASLLPVALPAAVARHARDQVAAGRTLLVPRSVAPSVVGAAAMMFLIVAALVAVAWSDRPNPQGIRWSPTSPLLTTSVTGIVAVALVVVASSAWFGFAARSPWPTVLFGCVLLTLLSAGFFGGAMSYMLNEWVYDPGFVQQRPGTWFHWHELEMHDRQAMRWKVLALGALSLMALGVGVTRSGLESRLWIGLVARVRGALAWRKADVSPSPSSSPHEPVRTALARVRLWRRASPFGAAAPWLLAAALALLMVVVAVLPDRMLKPTNSWVENAPPSYTDVTRPLLLVGVVPALAAAAAWRARRPGLAYESLFPVGRGAFTRELSAAITIDLAAFWLAAAVAAIASLAVTTPHWLASPVFWVGLTLTAAAQPVALGGLLFTVRVRWSPAPAVPVVAAALVSIALLFLLFTPIAGKTALASAAMPARLQFILVASLVTATVGAALSAIAFWSWRRTELG